MPPRARARRHGGWTWLVVAALASACGSDATPGSTDDAGVGVGSDREDEAGDASWADAAGVLSRADAGPAPALDAAAESAGRDTGAAGFPTDAGDAAVRGAAVRDAGGAVGPDGSAGMADAGGGSTGSATSRQPTGFASAPANGLATTSGGGSATPGVATSCAQLKSWLEDSTARVIELSAGATLDCRTSPSTIQACELQCSKTSAKVFWRVPVGDQTCTSLADFDGNGSLEVPAGTLVNKQRTDFTIRVKSNKTLRGAGAGATLLGVSLDIDTQSNIIVQNIALREINPSLIEAGDALTINNSHHVWIDHCAFSLISDGYMDIRYGSRSVTISYNHIDGANSYVCDGQHNFISLVSDSNVTYDHNYFDHVGGRNPKVTGVAQVHLYNNYYDSVSYFCANAGAGSELLVEANYYFNSRYPHWADGGSIEASGNQYAGSTSTASRDSNADVFAPPYSYALDPVSNLNATLPTQVGPHMLP